MHMKPRDRGKKIHEYRFQVQKTIACPDERRVIMPERDRFEPSGWTWKRWRSIRQMYEKTMSASRLAVMLKSGMRRTEEENRETIRDSCGCTRD